MPLPKISEIIQCAFGKPCAHSRRMRGDRLQSRTPWPGQLGEGSWQVKSLTNSSNDKPPETDRVIISSTHNSTYLVKNK